GAIFGNNLKDLTQVSTLSFYQIFAYDYVEDNPPVLTEHDWTCPATGEGDPPVVLSIRAEEPVAGRDDPDNAFELAYKQLRADVHIKGSGSLKPLPKEKQVPPPSDFNVSPDLFCFLL